MFKGSMVAIITPFDNEGRFDEEKYRQLIEFQIENGTDVIVRRDFTKGIGDFKCHLGTQGVGLFGSVQGYDGEPSLSPEE